jgi:ABC-type multidrug transport system fused ATPase/permease subunit
MSSTNATNVSFTEAVIQQCRTNPGSYSSVEACTRFGGVGYVVQYNYTAVHVAPLYQVLADEALVREALNDDNITIQLTIDPLPVTQVEDSYGAAQDATTAWFLVVLSFPFIAGAFATFVVNERQSKAKHLQTVAGVEPSAYWISTYLWDVLNYQIPMWITVILMFAFNIEVLTTSKQDVVSGVIVTLFLYGPASAAFTYCVSFAFTSAALCNVVVIIVGFLIAMGGPLATFILTLIGNDPANKQQNLIDAANILTWILRFFPAFNLGNGLFRAINISVVTYFEGAEVSAWSGPVLLYEVIFLAWESIVYLVLAIYLDKWSTNPRAVSIWRKTTGCFRCRCLFGKGTSAPNKATLALPDDDDVLREQDRVLSGGANNDLIVLSQLTKQYDDGKLAVNNISFGIPPGECFGLLGINGTLQRGSWRLG